MEFGPIISLTDWQVALTVISEGDGDSGASSGRLLSGSEGNESLHLQLSPLGVHDNDSLHLQLSPLGVHDGLALSTVVPDGRQLATTRAKSSSSSSSSSSMQFLVTVSGGIMIAQSLFFTIDGTIDSAAQSVAINIEHPGNWCPLESLGVPFCTPQLTGYFGLQQQAEPYLEVRAEATTDGAFDLIPNALRLTDAANTGGGPVFSVELMQQTKTSSVTFEVKYDGGVCITFGGSICFPVTIVALYDGGFQSITIGSRYTGGDIKPLAVILPDDIANMVVILGNEESPILFELGIGFGGGCQLSASLAATLQFNMPSFLGAGSLELEMAAEGCAIGQLQLIITAAIPAIALPGGLEFSGLTTAFSTYARMKTMTLPSGTDVDVPPGITILWAGASPVNAICPNDVLLMFSFNGPTSLYFEFLCTGFELSMLDSAPIKLPTINFLRFTSIGIYANVEPGLLEFGQRRGLGLGLVEA